jgi:uncharacterized OB-fold protein
MSSGKVAMSLPGEALGVSADGKPVLLGAVCRACGSRMFPPSPVCSTCMSEDVEREAMPRTGTLYSFTTVHVGPKNWDKPYELGYVDLENGVRVFAHLRGDVAIGTQVELGSATIGKTDDGTPITTFVFQPART